MYAAVDLGSNSFRLHIGEPIAGQIHIVRTARDPIRLAAGLGPDNVLSDAAAETALRCLRDFAAILRQHRLDAVRVVATNTLRVARNAERLLPAFEQAIGYPIEVISGEEEGRLIYMGVTRALGRAQERRLVVDIGGGSTELIAGHGADESSPIGLVESFSIGTHPQSAGYFHGGHVSADAFETAVNAARARIEDAADRYRALGWDAAYGSSGTIRAISEVIARNGIGDGTMSYPSLLALRDRLIDLGHVDAFDLPGVKRERVIVMVGGLSILIGVLQELGVQRMTAINAGLRLGVLSDLELRASRRDRRDQAIDDCLRRFGVDPQRAARTAGIARKLFDKLAPQDETLRQHLLRASMLHEVGQAISHTGAHKHAAYIVEHADLPGFTAREQRLMSMIVLGQKGNLRKVREALGVPDLAKAVLAMRLAAVFMHARVDGDVDALRLRMKGRIEIETPRGWLRQHPTVASWFDKEAAAWAEVGLAFQVSQAG